MNAPHIRSKVKHSILLAMMIFSVFLFPAAQHRAAAADAAVSQGAKDFLNRMSDAMADIAEVTKPSVVNISTTMIVTAQQNPFGDMFSDPLFRRFFGEHFGPPRKYKSSALGSGVIVSSDGYILTNYHVVKNATEISVTLYDKREFRGIVIGFDEPTDIAVVKVDATGLPAIKVGDSGLLKAGAVVLAIGNPFGLNQTITMGIVSAVGRANIELSSYEDFIQTDAAINPGNSGGALVNSNGELVGINTAIFSTSGGYMGIGFAIPSNMANGVAQSIMKYGKVIRGWLGVTVQDLTVELAKSFGVREEKGSLVTDVVKDGPAYKAGLKRGDVVLTFDGKTVDTSTTLRNMVANTHPGTKVDMEVLREGKKETLHVVVGELKEKKRKEVAAEFDNVLKGVHIQELTAELKEGLAVPEELWGVVVSVVDEDSPARGVLEKNDVIVEVNRVHISGPEDYNRIVGKIGPRSGVLLLVYRDGGFLYVTVRPQGS
jgi:serine protease Do